MQIVRHAPIKKTIFLIIGTVILYAICFLWLDRPLAYWIQQEFSNGDVWCKIGFAIQHIAKPSHWFLVGVAAAIVGSVLAYRKSEHAKAWLLFGVSLVITFVVCGVLKLLLGRYRPEDLFLHHLYGFHSLAILDDSGSPSGHTAMAFAAALSLGMIWSKRWLTTILLLLAALIGIFRLVINAHYLGDVVLAVYIGTLCVYWAQWILSRCSRLSGCPEHKKIDG